ncbi:hypothetical protein AB0H71_02170 [Nocardia sp. NPDC050697]|uniref:hypothetical protein n=1 Tax=Nocardia sp. NPDC050697 TaxID=3155158 RepID=UPI0033E58993
MLNEAQLAAGFGIAIGLPLVVLIVAVVWPCADREQVPDRPEARPPRASRAPGHRTDLDRLPL